MNKSPLAGASGTIADRYILIAYRPDGSNSCRGCTMESWDSKFEMHYDLTKEECIDRLSDILSVEFQYGSGFDYSIIMNGFLCRGYDYIGSHGSLNYIDDDDPNWLELTQEEERREKEVMEIANVAYDRSKEIKQQKQKKENDARIIIAQQEEERRKQQDLRELARLEAIYKKV